MPSRRGRATFVGLIIIAAVVAFLYTSGSLDPLLYRFGLNRNPCTHTLSGSIVCGTNIAGTTFNTNQASGGGGGGGSSGNPVGAAGAAGKSVSGSAGNSAKSVP